MPLIQYCYLHIEGLLITIDTVPDGPCRILKNAERQKHSINISVLDMGEGGEWMMYLYTRPMKLFISPIFKENVK